MKLKFLKHHFLSNYVCKYLRCVHLWFCGSTHGYGNFIIWWGFKTAKIQLDVRYASFWNSFGHFIICWWWWRSSFLTCWRIIWNSRKNFVKSWNFTWNHIFLVPGGKGADATNLAMSLCSSKRFFLNWNTTNQLNMWMAPKTPMSPMADTNSLWFIEVLRWPKNNINAIRTWNDSSFDQVFFLFDKCFWKKKKRWREEINQRTVEVSWK